MASFPDELFWAIAPIFRQIVNASLAASLLAATPAAACTRCMRAFADGMNEKGLVANVLSLAEKVAALDKEPFTIVAPVLPNGEPTVASTIWRTVAEHHCMGCRWKNSHIMSLAEMSRVLAPRARSRGSLPGQVCPPPSITMSTTSAPSRPES